jgi:hypothetical protein
MQTYFFTCFSHRSDHNTFNPVAVAFLLVPFSVHPSDSLACADLHELPQREGAR